MTFYDGFWRLLGGRFGPEKKYLAPPPKFPNSPQRPSRPLSPSRSWRALLGLSIKIDTPPSRRLRLPLPPPRAKKKKFNIRNVHQDYGILFSLRSCRTSSVNFFRLGRKFAGILSVHKRYRVYLERSPRGSTRARGSKKEPDWGGEGGGVKYISWSFPTS